MTQAQKRIRWILTGEGRRVPSPSSITGSRSGGLLRGAIVSFHRTLGWELQDGSWKVDADTSDPYLTALTNCLDGLEIEWSEHHD